MSELPPNWCKVSLRDVASTSSGIGFPLHYQGETSGDLGFYKVGDISRAVLEQAGQLRNPQHYVSFKIAAELKGKPVPPGSTVFAKIGEAVKLNRRAIVIHECLIDNNVMAVKAFSVESDRYLYMFLRTQDFTELSRATTVPSLRKGDIENLTVPFAPLSEQKRIADKLDAILARIDACRERLDRIPAILKRFRQAVLAAATSGKLTEDWRSTNSTKVEWETVQFADIGELSRGKSKHRPRNDSQLYGGSYPFIQTGDIAQSRGRITTHSQTYSELGLAQSKLWPSGTVCITIAANIADTAILSYPACFPDSVVGFIANPEKCLAEFIKWSIDVMSEQIESFAPATAQKNINLAILNDIEFLCPLIEEQTEIVRRVESLFAYADRLEARYAVARAKVDKLTPAILAKAFRGELVPQDPDDEPASLLLERIREGQTKAKDKIKRRSSIAQPK